jgi:hypothetical protein
MIDSTNLESSEKSKARETIHLFKTALDDFWKDMIELNKATKDLDPDNAICKVVSTIRCKMAKNFGEGAEQWL